MSQPRMCKTELAECLKELHLPTIGRCFAGTGRQAEQEALTHERYLLELVERECQVRRQNRIERLLRESRLPLEKTLETFDLKRLPASCRTPGEGLAGRDLSWTGGRTCWPSATPAAARRTCCAPSARN